MKLACFARRGRIRLLHRWRQSVAKVKCSITTKTLLLQCIGSVLNQAPLDTIHMTVPDSPEDAVKVHEQTELVTRCRHHATLHVGA